MKKLKSDAPRMFAITATQVMAVMAAADNLSAQMGGGEQSVDDDFGFCVKNINAFLSANGVKRKYK